MAIGISGSAKGRINSRLILTFVTDAAKLFGILRSAIIAPVLFWR
jgi:hypothetical protein